MFRSKLWSGVLNGCPSLTTSCQWLSSCRRHRQSIMLTGLEFRRNNTVIASWSYEHKTVQFSLKRNPHLFEHRDLSKFIHSFIPVYMLLGRGPKTTHRNQFFFLIPCRSQDLNSNPQVGSKISFPVSYLASPRKPILSINFVSSVIV